MGYLIFALIVCIFWTGAYILTQFLFKLTNDIDKLKQTLKYCIFAITALITAMGFVFSDIPFFVAFFTAISTGFFVTYLFSMFVHHRGYW